MGATRRTTDLPAIDASSICDAALVLTKESGIDGWSIRQLAKSIEAHPSIINYYVGRREDVVHLVIDRVNAEIDLPEYRGDWKPWFKALLEGLRSTLRGYPGVARRLAAVGPGLGESERIINRGIEVLSDAGFGDQAAFIEYQAKKGKQMIVSVGAAELDEMRAALEVIRRVNDQPLVLCHCVLEYPTPYPDAKLAAHHLA